LLFRPLCPPNRSSHTTSIDDKNIDTYLIVELKTVRGENAAQDPQSGFLEPNLGPFRSWFDDQVQVGPFDLLVNGPWFTKSRINSLRISIHPASNDTWWFDFILDLTFSDGGRISFPANGQVLGEEHRENVYTPLF
jgi:hypothetical protein